MEIFVYSQCSKIICTTNTTCNTSVTRLSFQNYLMFVNKVGKKKLTRCPGNPAGPGGPG